MAGKVETLVLKQGLPTVEEARARLTAALDRARKSGTLAIKIVHGYGASGFGGRLQGAVRSFLRKRQKEGLIRCLVPGENWSTFDEAARMLLDACPELSKDQDFNRYNEGITFVLL